MKKDKGYIAGALCFGLLLAAVLFFVVQLWRLNMLPNNILIPVVLLVLLVTALISLYLLAKPGKYGKKKPVGRYVAMGAAVLCIGGSLWGGHVITKVMSTMNAVTENPQISAIVEVRTRENDPAATLEDTKGYIYGITDSYDMENTRHILEQMEKDWGRPPHVAEFESVMAMFDALYQGKIDALVLNSAYIGILEHTEEYQDAGERTKVVHEFSLLAQPEENKPSKKPQTEADNPVHKKEITEIPFVMYLSGSDSRSSKITERSNTDVNILAAVNPVTKEILLVNTPRDYFIPNPAGNGVKDKLTHCGAYGIDCSVEALSDFYDTDISYYARINFAGFETLIDALGGITVESDVSFSREGINIRKGMNDLDGTGALMFARERYLMPGGDMDRGKNQMKVIQAVINKLTSSTMLTNYSQIMDSMQGMFLTDMSTDVISAFVKMQLSDMAQWNIHSYAVTGQGNSRITYSIPGMEVYVMDPDETMVAHATELIDRIMAGEILTEGDMETPEQ